MQAVHGYDRWKIPAPPANPPLTPFQESCLFREYAEEKTSVFTPVTVLEMLGVETALINGKPVDAKADDRAKTLRGLYPLLEQPEHEGPNKRPINSLGAILTEDVLLGYFDEELDAKGEKKDVLNIILTWSQKGDRGWVMPGMLDRSYANKDATMTLQDALAYLVKKELGVDRSGIAYSAALAHFDDPTREGRFKSFSMIGFVLLHRRPTIEPGKHVALPLNRLKELVLEQRKVEHVPGSNEYHSMARNHGSFLRKVFRTAQFYHLMEKIRIAQGNWREALRGNPHAGRPPLPTVEPNQECPNCMELMVGAHVICQEGHSICKVCLPIIRQMGANCIYCAGGHPLLANPIRNRALDDLIQSLNPDEYRKRFQAINDGQVPKSWEDHEAFCGNLITYKA